MSQRVVISEALAGLEVRTTDGTRVVFVDPPAPPAGVREPRRPKSPPPALTMTAEVPA
jgi:hypothetical protein